MLLSRALQFPIRLPFIAVHQPIGEFYLVSIPYNELVGISYADVRRMERQRDVESFTGIQRPLKESRVQDLRKYVTAPDATFPTSIIIAVDEFCAKLDEDAKVLSIAPFAGDEEHAAIEADHIARVIDGQHRIAGLETYAGPVFDLNVAIFIGVDISDQASIFSTVNLEQTKVNKSLAYDLLELATSRSPEKTCHNTAVALDSESGSPFYHKIKRLGVATLGRSKERLAQATFVKGLLPLVSGDPIGDRISLKKGNNPAMASASQLKQMPFRNLFIERQDRKIAKCMWDFFSAVESRWKGSWNSDAPGVMIARTNGYFGFMRFLRYTLAKHDAETLPRSSFDEIFRDIDLDNEDFDTSTFVPGTGGESRLFRSLRAGKLSD